MKTKEWIATGLIVIFFLLCKFVLPKPLQFSRTVSVTIMILMGLFFVGLLIVTLKGKYIERRIVFLLVGIALLLPFFMQFDLPLQISPEVQSGFDALDKLQPGAKILCSYDYDPPSG